MTVQIQVRPTPFGWGGDCSRASAEVGSVPVPVPVSVDADGVGGDPAVVQVSAECFTYDGLNRLVSAWTVAAADSPVCGGQAPADAGATGWDASGTAYAAQWVYSLAGKIDSLTQSVAGAASAVTGYEYSLSHPAAATSTTTSTVTGSAMDAFAYDGAGRMVSRTVNNVTTGLSWDVTSSLVESGKPGVAGGVSIGQGGHVVYAYDASGQRVLQARVPDASHTGSATGYVGLGEVTDTDTATPAVASALEATRFYSFGGATVAVRTPAGLSLMLGDEQGSVSVTMPLSVDTATGVVLPATVADALASTRSAYTPYGVLRGDDNLALSRGWLGQTEDRIEGAGASSNGTGLTYLNARYYDPVLSRFLSPDPLMDPGDPRTLDPYRYADNNPVVFTDASGLRTTCAESASKEAACAGSEANKGVDYVTGSTKVVHSRATTAKPKQWTPDKAQSIFDSAPGIKDYFENAGELAGELTDLADLGSDLGRKLRNGESVGRQLRSFRLDESKFMHYAAAFGRNKFVRLVGQLLGGAEADVIYFLIDLYGLYKDDYDVIVNPLDRWQFAAEHAMITSVTGAGWDTATDPVKNSVCLGTVGSGCAPAIVVQGAIGWGVQSIAGKAYKDVTLCREVHICNDPEIRPSLYGTFDPEGNPM